MTVLTDIINVQISRETQAVSRAAFNIPLFLAEHTAFAERTRTYTSFAALAEDFRSGSSVYEAGLRYFGQELVPQSIVIGRKQIDGVDGLVATVSNTTEYSVTINGVKVAITSDSSATAIEIVADLKAAVDAQALITGVTFTDNLDGTFDIDAVVPGSDWSVKASTNLTLTKKASVESWSDALTAVEASNNQWIALNAENHTDAVILELAEAIEAREKVYITSTSSAAVKTAVTTDVASQLKDLGYQKTALMWKADADQNFPECAWTGYQIQPLPGSNTWANKTLTGTSVDKISPTETVNLRNKNVNTYEFIGGVNATTGGKMSGGEFVDLKQVA
jgi:hypothetical protein